MNETASKDRINKFTANFINEKGEFEVKNLLNKEVAKFLIGIVAGVVGLAVLGVLLVTFRKNTVNNKQYPKTTEIPVEKVSSNLKVRPTNATTNRILAVYELEDKVIFATENLTSATFYTWPSENKKTVQNLQYGSAFTSSEKGETIKKNIKYQITLFILGKPTISETYTFLGNRAVKDYPACPYEQYIKKECQLSTVPTVKDETTKPKHRTTKN